MPERVLLTGSSGSVGRMISPHLAAQVTVRGFDLLAPQPSRDDGADSVVEHVTGSILEPAQLAVALEGVDAVVHLAGIPGEAAWNDLLRVNIDGTHAVLEAARLAGVRRIVLASSNHAVGFVAREQASIPSDLPPQPDSFYGVSKAAGEALGHLYHRRYGMDVVSIRIGTAEPLPPTVRSLATWISPRDLAGLVVAAIRAPSPLDAVVWGMSANANSPFSLDSGRALGYLPYDDARRVAAELGLTLAPESEADRRFVGGDFTT